MLDVIPYIIYFLGPFLLAFFIGKKILKATYGTFGIGLLAFFVAWVCILIVTQIPAAMSDSFKEGTLLYSLILAASAGLFEESSRFFAFRIFKGLREKRNWNTGIMYAIGHSGMESIIVGGSLFLTILVVKYAPQFLSPELLNESKKVLEIGFLGSLYNSLERLLVGLLIHGCFTCVVLLSSIKSRRYLLLAMLWHFGHNMIGFNFHYISEHWIAEKLWIVFIIVFYSWILFKLKKIIAREKA
jgi:uncharacterized membrane protein YhfC